MIFKDKKIKRILLYGFVLLFALIIISNKIWNWYIHELTWEELSWERNLDSLIYASLSELNENDLVFVIDKEMPYPVQLHAYIPGHFFTRSNFVGRYRPCRRSVSSDIREYDWEKVNFHVYDIVTKERVRTIDLLSLLEDVSSEFGYTRRTAVHELEVRETGELYLGFFLNNRGDSNLNHNRSWLRLNFHTGEVTVEKTLGFERQIREREENRNFTLQMSILSSDVWNVGDYDIFTINGIEIEPWGESSLPNFAIWGTGAPGDIIISLQAKHLPEESQSLYSRFPGLKQFRGREDLEVNVVITGYPTPEEILEMFMEDGREISFDGLRLRADSSIDGEEHDINSFEDHFKLRDESNWREDE